MSCTDSASAVSRDLDPLDLLRVRAQAALHRGLAREVDDLLERQRPAPQQRDPDELHGIPEGVQQHLATWGSF